MGFDFSISRPDRLLRVVGTGTLNFEVCSEAVGELISRLEGEAGFGILVDMRAAEYSASTTEIRRLATLVSEPGTLRGHRFAIVVSTTVMFGLGRMFCAYLELLGGEADVFRAIEPAMAWLNPSGVS